MFQLVGTQDIGPYVNMPMDNLQMCDKAVGTICDWLRLPGRSSAAVGSHPGDTVGLGKHSLIDLMDQTVAPVISAELRFNCLLPIKKTPKCEKPWVLPP